MNNEQETELACKTIATALENATNAMKPSFKKCLDDFSDTLYEKLHDAINCESGYAIQQHIEREAKQIVEKLLMGDKEALAHLRLSSDWVYGDIEKVKFSIWRSCGTDIENSLIKELQERNKHLEDMLKSYRR